MGATMANTLGEALRLAKIGYRVFPCKRDKSPLSDPAIGLLHGLHDATADGTKIRLWWQRHPEANIGLNCFGLVVIDDDREKKGLRPWLADEPEKQRSIASAALQQTPSGGRHWVFAAPRGMKWKNKQLAEAVDVKTSGGYVCVSPSRTDVGGYAWINELPPIERLPEPPGWLLAALDEACASEPDRPRPASPPPAGSDSRAIEAAVAALQRINIVDGHDGSRRLFAAACRCVERNLSDIDAVTAIRLYSATRPFPVSWSDEDILRRIRDAETRVIRGRPQSQRAEPEVDLESDGFIPPNEEPPGAQSAERGDSRPRKIVFEGLSLAELDKGDYAVEWLIERFLVSKQPAIVGGAHKSLKTLICMDMAISLATGTEFLGHFKINRALRVIFMSGEGGCGVLQDYARRICASKRLAMADAAGVIVCDRVPLIDQPGHAAAVQEFLMSNEAEVVFIDPVYRALSGADAGNLFVMGARLDQIHEAVQQVGATPVLLHHIKRNRIDPNNPPDLQDLSWAGFAEHAGQWFMIGRRAPFTPNPRGLHELELNIGGRAGQSGRWGLDIEEGLLDSEIGRYWHPEVLPWDSVAEAAKAARNERQLEEDKAAEEAIIRILSEVPEGEGVFINHICETTHIGRRRCDRILDRLTDEGLVERCEAKYAEHHKTTKSGAYRLTKKWYQE